MSTNLRHRLTPPVWSTRETRAWKPDEAEIAAHRVADQLFWSGSVLPYAAFAGARVFPVVAWDFSAVTKRLREDIEPFLSPRAVQDRLSDGTAGPSPLRMLGFLGIGQLADVRRELAGLRSMGRTVAVTSFRHRPRRMTLAEYDAQGTAVIAASSDGAYVLVGGDSGPRLGSAMAPVWRRYYEEQLFEWGMRHRLPDFGQATSRQAPWKVG